MSKKSFGIPEILFSQIGDEPDDPISGGGSAHGSNPVSFAVWLTIYNESIPNHFDFDHDGDIDVDDYYLWWIQNGYTREQWESANPPSVPWPNP